MFNLDFELQGPGCGCLPGNPRTFLHFGTDINTKKRFAGAGESNIPVGQAFTEIDYKGAWSIGLGKVFLLPLWGREFRIKPSFEYYGVKERLVAIIDNGGNFNTDTDEFTSNAIGPGLGLEKRLWSGSNLALDAVLNTRFLFFLKRSSNLINQAGGGQGDFRYAPAKVLYLSYLGVRLSYLGFGLGQDYAE